MEPPRVLDDVTRALEALTTTLGSEDDFTVLLHQVCEQLATAVPGVKEVTITVLTDGKPETVASTSAVVLGLDRDQYDRGDGPCLEAIRRGEPVRVSVTETAQRWPDFARDAIAAGFGSVLSAPLVVSGEHSNGINCYSDGFAELDEKLLDAYTGTVTVVLRAYHRYHQARDRTEDLRTALSIRAVINQAKGILMAVRQISADEAFMLLVEQAERDNVTLHDLAVRFVANAARAPS